MGFLASIAAKLLEKFLVWGGKALYDLITEFVEKHKQDAANKKNLKEYEEAKKKGDKDEILDKERDLINGD